MMSGLEEKVDDSCVLCVCMRENLDGCLWYTINPNTPSDAIAVSRMPTLLSQGFPTAFASVVLGTKIYVLGGCETTLCNQTISAITKPIMCVPSSRVYVYDFLYPNDGWKMGVYMTGGKIQPVAAVIDGKIFVLGSSLGYDYPLPAEPWAEVFDPNSNSWSDLPYPPHSVLSSTNNHNSDSVVDYTRKSITLSCRTLGLATFDATNRSWMCHPYEEQTKEYNDIDLYTSVIVGDVVYVFSYGRLLACPLAAFTSLANCSRYATEVHGLQSATDSARSEFTPIFLLHLGMEQLCLVWCVDGLDDKQHICTVTFHVRSESDGQLHAHICHSISYLAKGKGLVDCLALNQSNFVNVGPVAKSKISNSAIPVEEYPEEYVRKNKKTKVTLKETDVIIQSDGQLHADICQSSSYLAKEKSLVDCLALNQSSFVNVGPVANSKISDSAFPGTRRNMVSYPKSSFAFSNSSQEGIPSRSRSTQVTRHAHRVYVGGLPAGADEQKIVSFFGHVLVDIGAHTGPALAVVNIHINREKNFAILEMSSVALASNTMALNGIIFEGTSLRIRRPSDYNPGLAADLGPTQPSCYLKLEAIDRLPLSATNDQDSMFRRKMLALAWEASIPHSNGLDARRSRVVCLLEAVCPSNPLRDDEYKRLEGFFWKTGEIYGKLKSVYVPRPDGKQKGLPIGRVFLEYELMKSAVEAMEGINGKVLGRERVLAFYYPEDKYASKEWDYLDDYINLKNWAEPTFSRKFNIWEF